MTISLEDVQRPADFLLTRSSRSIEIPINNIKVIYVLIFKDNGLELFDCYCGVLRSTAIKLIMYII